MEFGVDVYGYDPLLSKEEIEAVGEAINLGSGTEHRVIAMANMVNELALGERSKFYKDIF